MFLCFEFVCVWKWGGGLSAVLLLGTRGGQESERSHYDVLILSRKFSSSYLNEHQAAARAAPPSPTSVYDGRHTALFRIPCLCLNHTPQPHRWGIRT